MTRIKICGVTSLADARYAAGAGADFVGFVHDKTSPRYIEPSFAKEIINWLYGPEPVGVFVDEDPERINEIADQTGLRLAQLHGRETPAACAKIRVPVIKAFRFHPDETVSDLSARIRAFDGAVQYVLIDSFSPDRVGGTGVTNRFEDIAMLDTNLPMFVAGGLTPENVRRVSELTKPFAVDVSSGVETSPGVKDYDRIDSFVSALRPTVSSNPNDEDIR
ncbi:MAG: phosphoribosylanthranilate isomerase [Bacteroidetes bacterium]|nr:phosphoribosylanthranilate isomerase [Bacteroidota bacterium]